MRPYKLIDRCIDLDKVEMIVGPNRGTTKFEVVLSNSVITYGDAFFSLNQLTEEHEKLIKAWKAEC